jgi:putative transposase
MPRCARLKAPTCTYHIMVRSISEVPLYKEDADKDRYLRILKKYQDLFLFKLYAYCIMNNHAHFIIYSNGADISKIMHGINQSYAQYYNRKYGRHGHLFQDRFKSKIVKDESYLISLSGYIHNNPSDIDKYEEHIERYPYSSLGIYLGISKDTLGIIDSAFILKIFGGKIISGRRAYRKFILSCTDINNLPEIEFENDITEYRSQKAIIIRDYNAEDIAEYISKKMGLKKIAIKMKGNNRTTRVRALYIMFLRTFCDLKYSEICKVVGGITQSRASKLCSIGIDSIQSDAEHRKMISEFIKECKAS